RPDAYAADDKNGVRPLRRRKSRIGSGAARRLDRTHRKMEEAGPEGIIFFRSPKCGGSIAAACRVFYRTPEQTHRHRSAHSGNAGGEEIKLGSVDFWFYKLPLASASSLK